MVVRNGGVKQGTGGGGAILIKGVLSDVWLVVKSREWKTDG